MGGNKDSFWLFCSNIYFMKKISWLMDSLHCQKVKGSPERFKLDVTDKIKIKTYFPQEIIIPKLQRVFWFSLSISPGFLAHLNWKLKWAFLIACCPSSVCVCSVCLRFLCDWSKCQFSSFVHPTRWYYKYPWVIFHIYMRKGCK